MTTDLIKHSKLVKVSIIRLINYEYEKSASRAFKFYIHTIHYNIEKNFKFLSTFAEKYYNQNVELLLKLVS